jgi:RNA polymerase-binding transcription factor DksA
MKVPLSTEEIRAYERRLRQMLASHAGIVERIERQVLEPSGEGRFQSGDGALEAAQLEDDLDALAGEDDLGYETREALERIAKQQFGLCEGCGAGISRQRLAILPYARSCASCARGSPLGRG